MLSILEMIVKDVHDIAFTAKIVYQQLEETEYHETLPLTPSSALYTSYISRIGSIIEATVKFLRPHHDEMAYRGTLSTQREKFGGDQHEEYSHNISLQNGFAVVFQL
jgi:hypothetical protein